MDITEMDITEVIQFVDRLIYEKNGKHLDDLQQTIIEGLWNGENYEQIGKKKDMAAETISVKLLVNYVKSYQKNYPKM